MLDNIIGDSFLNQIIDDAILNQMQEVTESVNTQLESEIVLYLSEISEKIDSVFYALTLINCLAAFVIALLLVIIFAIVWGRH